MPEYLQWLSGAFEHLVNMNMHPMVTITVSLILLVSRIKFEEPHIQAAKDALEQAVKSQPEQAGNLMIVKKAEEQEADKISHIASAIALVLSLLGQFIIYWPKSGQARALCFYFAFAQFGTAMVLNWVIDKAGLMNRLIRFAKKKADTAIDK